MDVYIWGSCSQEEETAAADTDSIDEEVEPKLKYVRMSNNLKDILLKDAASCIAVHSKFVCLGTHWGVIHLLDHQGNVISVNRKLPSHTVSVNQISIDAAGETIASCSYDGKVHVVSLFATNDQDDQTLNVGRLVRFVALDPAPGAVAGRRLIIGDDKLTLYERTGFLGRWRATVLCEAEGHVNGLAWGGDFVAWASTVGVRVYDMSARCSLGLIQWESGGISGGSAKYRCNLRWVGRTLLIGWVDTVRVCVIRKRSGTGTSSGVLSEGLPEHIVDPVSTFRPDLIVSGVAPLGGGGDQLVLLGVPKEPQGDKNLRPSIHVIEYRDSEYTELCTDSLSLRGYKEWGCDDYRLDVLPDEDRFFVVAPKDIVLASPYDPDDRVQWLVRHARYEEALAAVQSSTTQPCIRHTEQSVGGAYLDHLLAERRWQEAARLCTRVFGKDRAPWQEHIYKFARAHQLRAVAPYLPRNAEAPLDPQVYEMVLYEHLRLEPKGFLSLVREWREPGLYNTAAVTNAVLECLMVTDTEDKPVLLEALAVLYGYNGRYDKALSMYLKLGHPGVFQLIQKNGLQHAVHDMIADLMSLDSDRACDLLLGTGPSSTTVVPPEVVVSKLEKQESLLHAYLQKLDRRDSKLSGPYHGRMVRLYSIFDRDRLLPFLKRSDNYPIQEALEICKRQRYYPEMVYLLGRIGDTREALELINRELGDMQQALAFCQEHDDPDLWGDLIEHSLERPELITFLLPRIGGHVDPTVLVQRIALGLQVPGLRQALVSMLRQSRLQASIQEGCQILLVADYFGLHEKLVGTQKRGLAVSDELVCGACHHKLLAVSSPATARPLVVYNCRHCFHETCLPQSDPTSLCAICHPHQNGLKGNM